MKQQFEQEFLETWEVPPRKSWKYRLCVALGLLAACAAIASMASCHTPKKAMQVLKAHPKESAKYCAENHPVKESIKTVVKHKPGKPYPVPGETQYVTVDCDSAVRAAKEDSSKLRALKSAKVKVPVPTYLQVDTLAITTKVTKESSAALKVKEHQIDSFKQVCTVLSSDRTKALQTALKSTKSAIWGWSAFVLLSLIVAVYLFIKGKR